MEDANSNTRNKSEFYSKVIADFGLWFILGKISHFVRDDKCFILVVIPSDSEESFPEYRDSWQIEN